MLLHWVTLLGHIIEAAVKHKVLDEDFLLVDSDPRDLILLILHKHIVILHLPKLIIELIHSHQYVLQKLYVLIVNINYQAAEFYTADDADFIFLAIDPAIHFQLNIFSGDVKFLNIFKG